MRCTLYFHSCSTGLGLSGPSAGPGSALMDPATSWTATTGLWILQRGTALGTDLPFEVVDAFDTLRREPGRCLMAKTRREFTREFKQEAVALWEGSGRPQYAFEGRCTQASPGS